MKELNFYDARCEFLESKGFRKVWGSPSEVFLKLLESLKQRNPQFKVEASKIENAYDKYMSIKE